MFDQFMEEQFPVQIKLVGGSQIEIKQEMINDANILLLSTKNGIPDVDLPAEDEQPIEVEEGEEQFEQETPETNDSTMLDESTDPIDDIQIPEIPIEQPIDMPVNQTNDDHGKIHRKSLRMRRVLTHRYDPSSNQRVSNSTFSCPICRRRFKKKASMIYHRARHSYLFPIHCDTCYINFSSKADKLAHENKCNWKKFQCYLCAAIASSMGHLKGHMHKHTGVKHFECSKCKVKYAVKNSLVKHEKMKHQ